jgi:hypothetical protein
MLRNAALSLLGALPLLVAVPACFEVEKIDPGPFYIDTFENQSPRVASFDPWSCGPLNGQGTGGVEDPIQDVSCQITSFGGHATRSRRPGFRSPPPSPMAAPSISRRFGSSYSPPWSTRATPLCPAGHS